MLWTIKAEDHSAYFQTASNPTILWVYFRLSQFVRFTLLGSDQPLLGAGGKGSPVHGGCWTAPLLQPTLDASSTLSNLSCDNQKRLRALPNIPWGQDPI